MAEGERPAYCGQCGNAVRPGDGFCGECGAAVLAPPQQAEQVIPRPAAAAHGPAVRRNRRSLLLASVAGALVMLLAGGGALAFLGSGLGFGSVSPDAPPDPAFDSLLPTLRGMTDAPIMLPAKLPDELEITAIDSYLSESEDGYGIVFPYGPTERVAQVSIAETLGTLRAYPKEEDVANEYFDAESIEQVGLPDGTEATLRYMVPAGETGSQGPFWEGKFDRGGHTYVLTVVKPGEIAEGDVEQTLATMVEVEE